MRRVAALRSLPYAFAQFSPAQSCWFLAGGRGAAGSRGRGRLCLRQTYRIGLGTGACPGIFLLHGGLGRLRSVGSSEEGVVAGEWAD